jgi:hypothetical protein
VVSGLLAHAANSNAEALHESTLAERHVLVRHAWRADGGGPAQVSAQCGRCGEWSEFELNLDDVDLPETGPAFRVTAGETEVECRMPTPRMTEQAADVTDVVAACLGMDRDSAAPWVDAVEEALAQRDPLGQIVIVGACVECGEKLEAEFDLKSAWVSRIQRAVRRLVADIHTLATHYHWTEEDIMRIPEMRRRAYLDLCDAEPAEADWA